MVGGENGSGKTGQPELIPSRLIEKGAERTGTIFQHAGPKGPRSLYTRTPLRDWVSGKSAPEAVRTRLLAAAVSNAAARSVLRWVCG
jgi:hypothetical protein